MNLLAQSDDFGITPAVALGIVEAVESGIIRNTGLFANMPWADTCVSYIRKNLDRIAFGIDLNVSAGAPVLPATEVPGLVQENGNFLTSGMNRALDTEENGFDHVNYDEVYREFDAQVQRFKKIVGRLPDYIHGHAYGTKTTERAMRSIAKDYDRPFSVDVLKDSGVKSGTMEWYRFGNEMMAQFDDDLKDVLLEDRCGFLGAETAAFVCHAGYIDSRLFDLTSYTIYRVKDLAAVTDPAVLRWVTDNGIKLITYRDL